MQQRRRVAQHAVREHHQRVQRRVSARVQQPAAQDDRPGVGHHPPLARPLALDRGDHLLRRQRAGDVDRPPAALDHVEREREVVAHDRVDLDVRLGAHGVDRAVAGRHGGQRGLAAAHPHLVAPVDALLVRAALVDERHAAAGVADAGIVERRGERAQRARLPQGVGVAERQQLARGGPHRRVLGADLAAARQLEHEVGAGGPCAGGRVVGAGVGAAVDGHDQLERLARPVERQRVGDLGRDHLLLAVGGHDQRDARERRAARGGPGAAARARAAARAARRSRPGSRRSGRRRSTAAHVPSAGAC